MVLEGQFDQFSYFLVPISTDTGTGLVVSLFFIISLKKTPHTTIHQYEELSNKVLIFFFFFYISQMVECSTMCRLTYIIGILS